MVSASNPELLGPGSAITFHPQRWEQAGVKMQIYQ
jgi:hypothetical protein